MNRNQFLNLAVIILLTPILTYADNVYPTAITNSGVLFGKYKISNDVTNSIADTISLEDAKNIFAINAIYIDKDQKLNRVKVIKFQMTIFEKGDTTTIKNNSEMLSSELKERLNRIKPGAKLYFEGIMTEFPGGDRRQVIILSFTVI